jgi:argininosuccinate lyase
VSECLEIAAPLVERATLHREAIRSRLDQGFLDATTLMEYMMGRGVPQRVAHHAVGTLVRTAMERGVRLADLTLDDFRQQWPEADPGLFGVLGVANAVQAFASYGSTAPPQVAEQLQRWKRQLGM